MIQSAAMTPPIVAAVDDAPGDQHTDDTEPDDDAIDCGRCGERIPPTEDDDGRAPEPVKVGDELWCLDCADDHSNCCDGCGDRLHTDSLRWDRNDNPYCEHCESDGRWDSDVADGQTIFEHDTNILHVLDLNLDPRTLYLGFELELDAEGDNLLRWDAAHAFMRHHETLGIVKHDGSIGDGDTGLEFVSRPFTHNDCRNAVTALLDTADVMRGLEANPTCGMHVHVSRAPLSTCTLLRLACFIHNPANTAFLEHLAGRKLAASRWAMVIPNATWRTFYAPENPLKVWHYERYLALNLTNVATIEFRLFASTTNAERARANLDACAALVAFCATGARDRASALSARAFLDYACENRRSFPDLAAFLNTPRIATEAA